jgi:23S rRNA pseudouridine2605 synthase
MGVLSRSQATRAILEGRVRVNGRVVQDPARAVAMQHARIEVDGMAAQAASWRTILMNKPRSVLTTRHDPEGRTTIYDIVRDALGLVPVGRLDFATTGLVLLTTDTALASWITDPANGVPRAYLVTVRGKVTAEAVEHLMRGVVDEGEALRAAAVRLRKASGRESHLVVELREGKNREVRRLFRAIGHEVTRLSRVQLGGLSLGTLAPGEWRECTRQEIRGAFPGAPLDEAPAHPFRL